MTYARVGCRVHMTSHAERKNKKAIFGNRAIVLATYLDSKLVQKLSKVVIRFGCVCCCLSSCHLYIKTFLFARSLFTAH